MKLEKKIQACTRFEPMTAAIPVQYSTNWANKPTVSCLNSVQHCEDRFHLYSILNPQFTYTGVYDFHIFTVIYSSLYGFITNKHNDQRSADMLAQLVEHCTGIAEVMGTSSVQAYIFSGLIFTTHVLFK